MNPRAEELRTRARRFAVRTGKFLRTLPRDPVTLEIVRQLAQSSGGLSANYHACCRARSRAEFIAKLGVAVEEADESEHWLKVLIESDIGIGSELDSIYNESRELRAVFKASHDTLAPITNANKRYADGPNPKSINPEIDHEIANPQIRNPQFLKS
jgi:four helix bundle protein